MGAAKARERRRWDDALRFDRSDRIGLIAFLVVVVVAGFGAWVVLPIRGWINGDGLLVGYRGDLPIPDLAEAGVEYTAASYQLVLTDPTGGERFLDLLPGLGYLIAGTIGAVVLVLLARDVGAGRAFRRVNVTRLRTIAALVGFGIPVLYLGHAMVRVRLLDSVLSDTDIGVRLVVDLWPIAVAGIVGAAVALVAEAFNQGARLQDDLEGLV